jgi:2-methylcitrate dehydratase PrpD
VNGVVSQTDLHGDATDLEGEMAMQTTSAETGSLTAAMTAYAAEFGYDRLSPATVAEAKTIVLDTLGAILLGSAPQYTASWLTGELARQMGGRPECTVIGRSFKASCESAALANGTMGYAADVEGAGAARQHVPAVLVPTALVMGEREHADGRRFLAALALGYEVSCRVSEAARPPHSYPHSFHPSAVFGYFGAAATSGHILGLDQEQFANAIGLAGSNASGLMTWVTDKTENSRPFVIGMAARGGVTSALLAKLGFGGPPAILDDAKYSIYDAYAGEAHPERLLAGLGEEELWIRRAGGFKRHPCCGDIHTGIDGLVGILEDERIATDDIARIVHRVKADRFPVIDGNELKSHCAQYIMAVAAVNRKIGRDDILLDQRADPRVETIYRRVTLVGDPKMDPWEASSPAVVELTTTDGRRFTRRVDWPKGNCNNPMTRAELEAKFFELATTRIPRDRAERLMELVYDLENLADVSALAELLQCDDT